MAKFIYSDEPRPTPVSVGKLSIPIQKMMKDATPAPSAQPMPTRQAPAPSPLAAPVMAEAPRRENLGKAAPQAAALVRAAESGAPFCEQCSRMA